MNFENAVICLQLTPAAKTPKNFETDRFAGLL